MKILILGATGRTGQHLVLQSLEKNYEVTALARDPSKINIKHPGLTVIKGNVLDKELLTRILENKDAVLSSIGAGNSLRSRDLIANAAEILIPAMEEKGISRLIFLSAFGVGDSFAQASFIQKLIFRLPLKNIYTDKEKGEKIIRNSDLSWTLVYPVLLTDKPGTGTYRHGESLPMKGMPKISRADVAHFMIKQLTDDSYVKRTAVIMN
jgi:putative NADH-flavin reductase